MNRNIKQRKTRDIKSNSKVNKWWPKHQILQYHKTNINTRKQNKFRVNIENHEWKEDYITIPQEQKLQKCHGRIQRK